MRPNDGAWLLLELQFVPIAVWHNPLRPKLWGQSRVKPWGQLGKIQLFYQDLCEGHTPPALGTLFRGHQFGVESRAALLSPPETQTAPKTLLFFNFKPGNLGASLFYSGPASLCPYCSQKKSFIKCHKLRFFGGCPSRREKNKGDKERKGETRTKKKNKEIK